MIYEGRFFRCQRSVAFLATAGGLLFWWNYGFLKGLLFAVAVVLSLQVPIGIFTSVADHVFRWVLSDEAVCG